LKEINELEAKVKDVQKENVRLRGDF